MYFFLNIMKIKTYKMNWNERLFTVYTDALQGSLKYGNPLVQLKHDLIYKN